MKQVAAIFLFFFMMPTAHAVDPLSKLEKRDYYLQQGSSKDCEMSIRPRLEVVDGRTVLVLSGRIRMFWENRSEQVTRESYTESSPGDFTGSMRDKIVLYDKQIKYSIEYLTRDSAGRGIVDKRIPTLECVWN